MKLEFKNLAPYLPYGLYFITQSGKVFKSQTKDDFEIRIFKGNSPNGNKQYHSLTLGKINRGEFKPILKPLSDFRDKIIRDIKIELDCSVNQVTELFCLIDGSIRLQDITLGLYTVLCKNHVDFNKLIENNLAIDINTLNTIK